MKKIIYSILAILLFGGMFTSCSEDSLEPTLSIEGDINSISSISDMQGIMYSVYDRMTETPYYGRDFIIYGEVRADNCWANGSSGRFLPPAAMSMGNTSLYAEETWQDIYEVIASCNAIITTDKASIEGDATELDHIYGQAYAIRALAHFDLLKLYGQQHTGGTLGVPYIKHFASDINDFTPEQVAPARNTVVECKTFIEDDLNMALTLMTEVLNDPSKQTISTYGIYGIMSRVAVYFEEWADAVTAAEAVISSGNYAITPAADLVAYWATDGGSSSIFELAYDGTDNNNINGLQQIYRGDAYGDIEVLDDLASIFEVGDIRVDPAMLGINPDPADVCLRNMGKYPNANYNDNIALVRYEEVILNYAEALFELGDATALTYLNMIPAQRNATAYAAATKANILLERRKELCFEGFRFDDLARTGQDIPLVDAFNQSHGGPAYGSYNYAFPIPQQEIRANGNMVQNTGY
ncbi:MAG: RagB/SusD family nutrient uptake outer membrane protein [Bacteroidales bacterium]|nr:RagB/SusD family nutrient uptake outer membrane protein [Bacteroidales bacterium]